jgi:hypothetical protein
MEQPVLIRSAPGIKRDGTQFEGDSYIDGLWMRFQRGLPRKIGGYVGVTSTVPEIARGMTSFSANGTQYLHMGGATTLTQITANSEGLFTGQSDRTPAGLVDSSDNLWQFDVMFDTVGSVAQLIAHAAPNLTDISSTTDRSIWYADMTDTGLLVTTGSPDISGGIVVLAPYLLSFGDNGYVHVSDPNDVTATASEAWITGQKIVRGMPLRGGGQGPSGIFWSLDSVLRATFVGDTPVFAYDTLSSESSILSSQSVIEYDGIYYWAGVDRFLSFNGVVREIPNNFNLNYFYDNLNYGWAQKVFAFKVPRYGEIWWCYPFGDATECTHAVIYNLRENYWYDTALPAEMRSIGVYAKVYSKPFMVDADLTDDGYTLYQHETGVDAINASSVLPIRSHFTTGEISMLVGDQATSKSIHVARIEPDFVQVGDMTVQVSGRANARAPLQDGEIFTFPDVATTAEEQIVNVKEVRRLMTFTFETNTLNGDYQMGQCIAHIAPADGRVTQ